MSSPVSVLLFQLGPRVFATRAAGVERIAGRREQVGTLHGASCLGRPWLPSRGLVVRTDDGVLAALAVDQVLGLRQVEPSALRSLPPLADGLLSTAAVIGLLTLDGAPTPLIDLATLIREQRAAATPDARTIHG